MSEDFDIHAFAETLCENARHWRRAKTKLALCKYPGFHLLTFLEMEIFTKNEATYAAASFNVVQSHAFLTGMRVYQLFILEVGVARYPRTKRHNEQLSFIEFCSALHRRHPSELTQLDFSSTLSGQTSGVVLAEVQTEYLNWHEGRIP